MKRALILSLALVATGAGGRSPARAEDHVPAPSVAGEIAWKATVDEAFEAGKKENKPIFVAINAAKVDGGHPEPAGKELREHVYVDPTVVARSQSFVCVLLRPDGSSADFAVLRQRFSIDGQIVSPQHIFAYPDGTLIDRREYWSYRAGQESVDALLSLMDKALAANRMKAGLPPEPPAPTAPAGPGGAPPPAPGSGEPGKPTDPSAPAPQDPRAAWINALLAKVRAGSADAPARDAAIHELVKGDQKGDCIEALCTVLLELKKDPDSQIAILKALGKPGLEIVVNAVASLLDDKHDEVRSNAAVTLEYVGSAQAIDALTKRLSRDKEEVPWSNACRALGRCGAKQEPVRKALLREMTSAKSARMFVGPVIGLAYFEKDAEVARALEKSIKKEGDYVKRGYMLWCLSEVGDPKSADFVKKEVMANEKDARALAFQRAIYNLLAGSDDGTARGTIDGGMGFISWSVAGIGGAARKDRDQSEFKPKGEFSGRGPGGPGGPGGGAPPGGTPPGHGRVRTPSRLGAFARLVSAMEPCRRRRREPNCAGEVASLRSAIPPPREPRNRSAANGTWYPVLQPEPRGQARAPRRQPLARRAGGHDPEEGDPRVRLPPKRRPARVDMGSRGGPEDVGPLRRRPYPDARRQVCRRSDLDR